MLCFCFRTGGDLCWSHVPSGQVIAAEKDRGVEPGLFPDSGSGQSAHKAREETKAVRGDALLPPFRRNLISEHLGQEGAQSGWAGWFRSLVAGNNQQPGVGPAGE